MVILHFSCIDDCKTNGVCVIVPQHVTAQGRFAETALININGIEVPDVPTQIAFSKPFDVRKLPEPFDRPDLAVFQECYRLPYLVRAENLRKNGIPYVIVPHGELGKEAQQKKHLKKKAANLLLFNRFTRNALAIQCLSDRECEETAFGRKRFVGTNGVEIPERKKEAFSRDGVKIVYIGRLDAYHKGLDLLIEAIALIKPVLLDSGCRVEIYGPDYAGRYDNIARLIDEYRVQDIVSLNHEILGDDKINKLLDSDVFVQTSRFEGMPLGILEAMSYGLPCVVTEGTALGDEITASHAGWVAKTTAKSIADCLSKAVHDRLHWAEFGNNGRNAIIERYSWDVIAAKTVSQYETILSYLK